MVEAQSGLQVGAIHGDPSKAKENLERRLEKLCAEPTRDYDAMEKLKKAIDLMAETIESNRKAAEHMARKQMAVNRRNKTANIQKDSKAGLRRKELEKEAAEKGDASGLMDPFIRRETRPTILWNTGKTLQVRAV